MFVFLTYSSWPTAFGKDGGAGWWHGNPVPAGCGGGGAFLRTVLGRLASCPTRAFTMESWGGWSWHISQAHWKPSVLRAKGTFSWVFRSKCIKQPQRNTSEARSGFLAGAVITKATGPLCIFCSCWRLRILGPPKSHSLCSPGSADPGSQTGERKEKVPRVAERERER